MRTEPLDRRYDVERGTQPQPNREGTRVMKTPAFLHDATDLRSVPLMGEPKRKLGSWEPVIENTLLGQSMVKGD